ncbi:hypothetical protein R1flu_005562 [Riccia fluitans]|uniref:Uncharacterized protein n=1 Tax=Riccia fluitans TaxID=41844 RepID=A0ABD1YTJ0_9MARC
MVTFESDTPSSFHHIQLGCTRQLKVDGESPDHCRSDQRQETGDNLYRCVPDVGAGFSSPSCDPLESGASESAADGD